MSRSLIPLGLVLWCGTSLLLSDRRWFSRRPLHERLRPYVPGGWQHTERGGLMSVDSFREIVAPLATTIGEALGHVLGLHEPLSARLDRIHSPLDAATLRVRQLTRAGLALAVGAGLVALLRPDPVVGLSLVLGSPLITFLVLEQQVVASSVAWQRRLFLELPVVSEQIGTLLGAGYSLGAALDRVSRRGTGCCAQDLGRVGRRVRHGLSEAEALREWADVASVPAVHRLVSVLALNRDTGDLGRLIAEEARTVRREVQRERSAQIDRRAQQVWIPVTVATLVPGTIFLAVPFLQTMQYFGA